MCPSIFWKTSLNETLHDAYGNTRVFKNTSIECLCVVRENIDRASRLIKLLKTLTKKVFECPYSCVHMNMDTQKFL